MKCGAFLSNKNFLWMEEVFAELSSLIMLHLFSDFKDTRRLFAAEDVFKKYFDILMNSVKREDKISIGALYLRYHDSLSNDWCGEYYNSFRCRNVAFAAQTFHLMKDDFLGWSALQEFGALEFSKISSDKELFQEWVKELRRSNNQGLEFMELLLSRIFNFPLVTK
jgi:hypothetical protein